LPCAPLLETLTRSVFAALIGVDEGVPAAAAESPRAPRRNVLANAIVFFTVSSFGVSQRMLSALGNTPVTGT